MAPSNDDFIASDAFGDFFFLGPINAAIKCPSLPDTAAHTTCPGVFTFPVRSRTAASRKKLLTASSSDSNCSLTVDAIADATATITYWASKEPAVREHKLGTDTDDLKATNSAPAVKYGGREYGRSASLDTRNPQHSRDQTGPNGQLSQSPAGDSSRTSCSQPSQEGTLLYSQSLAARRSGSAASSGGGAGPCQHHHQHHGGWHSTEWWRSFSSSRLNEMAAEEPDMRSPEMRKVPFTGGAEPMCALVHSKDERS